jgi:hypothetical protein
MICTIFKKQEKNKTGTFIFFIKKILKFKIKQNPRTNTQTTPESTMPGKRVAEYSFRIMSVLMCTDFKACCYYYYYYYNCHVTGLDWGPLAISARFCCNALYQSSRALRPAAFLLCAFWLGLVPLWKQPIIDISHKLLEFRNYTLLSQPDCVLHQRTE